MKKVNWSKTNITQYRILVGERTQALQNVGSSELPPEVALDRLADILVTTALECTPRPNPKPPTRKGPWNHDIGECMRRSKLAFHVWKQAGRPKGTVEHHSMGEARRDLRRAQRQASADIKRKHYNQIMEASTCDQGKFYNMIRKQRGKKDSQDLEMEFNGQKTSGADVVEAWADYFESLTTPDSHPQVPMS
jgi:hypothetical protein